MELYKGHKGIASIRNYSDPYVRGFRVGSLGYDLPELHPKVSTFPTP